MVHGLRRLQNRCGGETISLSERIASRLVVFQVAEYISVISSIAQVAHFP